MENQTERRKFLNNIFFNNQEANKLEQTPSLMNDFVGFEVDRSNLINNLELEDKPLNYQHAKHLLTRLTFGPNKSEIDNLIGKKPSEAVELLLGDGLDYLSQNKNRLKDASKDLNWLDTIEENPQSVTLELQNQIEGRHKNRYGQFLYWWMYGMGTENVTNKPTVEKLAFFWHTHWCVSFAYDNEDYIPPPLIFRNYDILRKYRLGNFKDFVIQMTLDGAYLLYQSLNLSHKDSPNENYMRELLELFTMGIENYSEGDIREGARTLTGWRVTAHIGDRKPYGNFETYFDRDAHDIGSKIIMGEKINSRDAADNSIDKVKKEEVEGLINILFNRRPMPIAEFICEKIFKFFVYSNPKEVDRLIISEMAKVFIDSNFELKPVFVKLFTSKYFYQIENIGVQIKTPPELILGLRKTGNSDFNGLNEALNNLEQKLYSPPNVGGWNGYRAWISTVTYPFRVNYCNQVVNGIKNNELIKLAQSIDNYTNFEQYVAGMNNLFLPLEASEERLGQFRTFLVKKMSFSATEWSNKIQDTNFLANATKEFLFYIIKLPDFQLC